MVEFPNTYVSLVAAPDGPQLSPSASPRVLGKARRLQSQSPGHSSAGLPAQTLPICGCCGPAHTTDSMVSATQSELLQAASQGRTSMPHSMGSGPLAESLEGTLPRWKDTCQGRAHPEPETVDFGDRHHKKGAAGRNACGFDLSLSEEPLQRVTGLMQVTHTEV